MSSRQLMWAGKAMNEATLIKTSITDNELDSFANKLIKIFQEEQVNKVFEILHTKKIDITLEQVEAVMNALELVRKTR